MSETLNNGAAAQEYGAIESDTLPMLDVTMINAEARPQPMRKRRRTLIAVAASVCASCLVAVGLRQSAVHNNEMNFAAGQPYDHATLFLQAWFATAAYCGNDDIMANTWSGPAAGFNTTKVIEVVESDLMAFVGYSKSQNYIEVTFRGTETANNWAVDLMALPLDTHYPDCPECMVHGGFWASEIALIAPVLQELQWLVALHPSYDVYVAGHSLGGALAMLAALDMCDVGIKPRVYTYGMPRVGNRAWAEYAMRTLPLAVRITHNRDMVVHAPPQSFGFWHTGPEVFENAEGELTLCDNGEDPLCANRFPLWQTNVQDHMLYMGIDMTKCSSLGWLER